MGFFLIALSIWTGINVYIGIRGLQAFGSFIPPGYVKVYWVVFIFMASSFLLVRIFESTSNSILRVGFEWVSSYTMAVIFYALLILVLIDIVRLLDHWLGFIPMAIKQSPAGVGLAVFCLLVGLLSYGTWNAWHPVFREYEINIPKNTNGSQELHAIMISDLHLGNIVNHSRLTGIIEQINQRNPDVIFLAGDVIDDNIRPFIEQKMAESFRELKPRLGIYMVLGNHDGHTANETVAYLKEAGITVLRDQYQLVDDRFYLVGRENRGHGISSAERLELTDILVGINHRLPIIMMDHNPSKLEEAQINGIDMQLSGHTHQGQLFPLNQVTQRMYEIDWGYLRKENLQVVVSTGVGTWGPPIRIGNTPEIVDLHITFNK